MTRKDRDMIATNKFLNRTVSVKTAVLEGIAFGISMAFFVFAFASI